VYFDRKSHWCMESRLAEIMMMIELAVEDFLTSVHVYEIFSC